MAAARKAVEGELIFWGLLIGGGYVLIKSLPSILPSLTNNVATAAGQAAGAIANAAVTAPVTAVSAAVGIPTPADTTTDPLVARWILDYPGTGGPLAASQWASVSALYQAVFNLPAGSGVPGPVGTAVNAAFPPPIDWTSGSSGSW
jgi:hypothetical protein